MKHKMAAAVLAALAVATVAHASSWKITVGTTNTLVAPDLSYAPTNVWASGEFDAQSYVVNSNGVVYWTPNGGSSTNQPVHRVGIVAAPDAKWLAIRRSARLPRNNIEIQSTSSGDVWIKRGTDAVKDECTLLNGRGAARQYSSYQGPIYAVAGTGEQTVIVQEW